MANKLIFGASLGVGILGSLAFFAIKYRTPFEKRVEAAWDRLDSHLKEEKNLIKKIADLQGKITPLKKQLGFELVNLGDQFSDEELSAQLPEVESELRIVRTDEDLQEAIEFMNDRIDSLRFQEENCERIYRSLMKNVAENRK